MYKNEMSGERQEQLHEKKKHGSPLFPFNIYPCTIPGDFHSVSLHWQKSMELIYVKKGRGIVQLDMCPMDVMADDILIVPPGTLHAIRRHESDTMEYENIIFDIEFLGSGAADVCAQEYLIPLSAGRLLVPMRLRRDPEQLSGLSVTYPDSGAEPASGRCSNASDDPFEPPAADASDGSFDAAAADASDGSFEPAAADRLSCILPGYREITSCLILAERLSEARPKGYELGVKAAILRLISLLIPLSPDQPREESPYLERLKLVLNRVEHDYTHPLSIREISDFCGCSSSHFMRWFRQMTGSSFIHYVNERRLAYSAELLRQTDDKIISIAEKAGYDNLSNFNRQFKSRYGVTPGEYRKKSW